MASGSQADWAAPKETMDSYPGTLRAYREFKILSVDNQWKLAPIGMRTGYNLPIEVDSEGWMTAECRPEGYNYDTKENMGWTKHAAPKAECKCGYYLNYYPGQSFYSSRGVYVYAVVEAAGKVVLSKKGFRASKMRILAYTMPCHKGYEGADFSEYKKYEDRTLMMYDYPQVDLTGLIGIDAVAENIRHSIKCEAEYLKEMEDYAKPKAATAGYDTTGMGFGQTGFGLTPRSNGKSYRDTYTYRGNVNSYDPSANIKSGLDYINSAYGSINTPANSLDSLLRDLKIDVRLYDNPTTGELTIYVPDTGKRMTISSLARLQADHWIYELRGWLLEQEREAYYYKAKWSDPWWSTSIYPSDYASMPPAIPSTDIVQIGKVDPPAPKD